MISQVPALAPTLHIQHLADRKLKRRRSQAEHQARALLTHPVHQATNHRDQQADPTTQDRQHQPVVQPIQVSLQPAALVISHQAHRRNIPALKVHTQVPELQSHHPTCHHRPTALRNKAASRPRPTPLTPHQELHKRRTENTYRHDGDKLMQMLVYISLFMRPSHSHRTTLMIDNSSVGLR